MLKPNVVMTDNAANSGSSLHKIATFQIITEWDQGKLSLLELPWTSLEC
ncbi:MAG TPA: hypothetical protein V6D19_03850 [Stenomitos sp.]